MQWSTSTVLQDTMQRVRAAGLYCAPLDTLPTLHDVDTGQDLAAWLAAAPSNHVLVPVACAALAGAGRDARPGDQTGSHPAGTPCSRPDKGSLTNCMSE